MRLAPIWIGALALLCPLAACQEQADPPPGLLQTSPEDAGGEPDAADPDADALADAEAEEDAAVIPEGPRRAELSHTFGDLTLEPFQETSPCVQWTLNNDEALYVEQVRLSNNGGYHHSNWFVVPEDLYPGEDGFFRCSARNFDELGSALRGTVLFAQSTQSQIEAQYLGEGIAIKIPPRHKVVADVHLLNLAPRAHATELRMALDLIHPVDVKTVVAPFRLSYLDLDIPPRVKSRFTGDCLFKEDYERVARRPFDLKLYWVLPHFHQLGDHFKLEILGGARDGEIVYQLDGFNAGANGRAFAPPLDLTGAEGLRFTCGYDNPTARAVGWGIGDQEMCVMLGFADGGAMIDASVVNNSAVTGQQDGIVTNAGPCLSFGLPRNPSQTMPTDGERGAPLYVPEQDPSDADLSPVITCQDGPLDAEAEAPITFTSVRETIFEASCTFGACHDVGAPAGGLALDGDDLHAALMAHPGRGNAALPLIAPGDPEGSWLYQVISRCEPVTDGGEPFARMPLNAPNLLDPALVAKVRDWIASGAPND